ncbi:MAG TPA: Na+/H+ antiporter NhaA [Stackebrandtia sp.]|jgi:NhaA family Na+:H+ antiporter|uniref:Na+/H+ antiporter NhaA n=1 Tax=Stackebrandtia sp. TaxID=2023065 RepID=UPI002D35B533|nr:Na+/H+ antiporter NhaA [Stackebrandtia sp.]HZE38941.1 Na+/H+ antiporter NhaA [Stackebrandtia sp.]
MVRNLARRVAAARAEAVRYLRVETTGGIILLGATVAALVVANCGASGWYHRLSATVVGPHALHLDLTVQGWAQDGLLTVFFLVAGLELKRELMSGELSTLRRALLPVFGAAGGMVVPAAVAAVVAAGTGHAGDVWPVPTATDIAFALAVLAVAASALPPTVRVFLLSLAVVDDLGAIILIAVLFTGAIHLFPALLAAGCVALYWVGQKLGFRMLPVYIGLGVLAWVATHASGIHPTIAGVVLAFATRGNPMDPDDERPAPALRLEHALQPISAGICVPVFAFFAAGISLNGADLLAFGADRVAVAVVAGLLIGKFLGVYGGTRLAVATGLASVPRGVSWRDLAAVSVLTGCGFTVSLLIAELSFPDPHQQDRVKAAVLLGSVLAAVIAALLLRRRVRRREENPHIGR